MSQEQLQIDILGLTGFKSQNQSHTLDKLNLLTGPNGTGKSAHLAAAQFACQGYTHLGKRDEDTAELADARGCAVHVRLSDGFNFTRSLERREDRISTSINIAGEKDVGIRKLDPIIKNRVGDFAPMWDVDAFLGLSPDKRRDFLLDLCARATGGSSEVEPVEMVRRVALEFLRLHPDVGPATVETFLQERFGVDETEAKTGHVETLWNEKLSDRQVEFLVEILSALESEITGEPSEAIGSALDWSTKWTLEQRDEERRGREAARELAARKAEIPVPAGDVATLRDRLATLQTREKELISKIAQCGERVAHEKTLRSEIQRAEYSLAETERQREYQAHHDTHTDEEAEALDMEANEASRIAGNDTALKELLKERADLEAERTLHIEANAAATNARDRLESIRGDIQGHEQAVGENRSAVDLRDQAKMLEESSAKVKGEALQRHEVCKKTHDNLLSTEREQAKRVSECDVAVAKLHPQVSQAEAALRSTQDSPWTKAHELLAEIAEHLPDSKNTLDCLTDLYDLIESQSVSIEDAQENLKAAQSNYDAAVKLQEVEAKKLCDVQESLEEADSAYSAAARDVAQSEIDRDRILAEAHALYELANRIDALEGLRAEEARWQAELDKQSKITNHSAENNLADCNARIEREQRTINNARLKTAELRRQASDIRRIIEAEIRHARELTETIESLTAKRAGLAAKLKELTTTSVDVDALIAEKDSVVIQAGELARSIREKERFDVIEEQLTACQYAAEQRGVAHGVGKLVVQAIKVLRERLMTEMTAPVSNLMDDFLVAYDGAVESFIQLDNPTGKRVVFRMGWKRDGREVEIKALSGGEQAVFSAALGYALIKLADPPLKLLLVEASEIDHRQLGRLMAAIESVQVDIGNAIVATHLLASELERETSAWNVIELKAPVKEAVAV